MQGCRRACLAQLALWGGLAAAFFFYARSVGHAGREIWPVSIGVALLTAMALLFGSSAFTAIGEQRMLTRKPVDGKWTAVCGEIRSSAPARAPLSGELVAAYEYAIERYERIGRSSSRIPYFYGKALTASTIGTVRLLAVPALDVEAAAIEKSRAVANARAYLRTVTFADRSTGAKRTAALEREWADDDGVYRIDNCAAAAEIDDTFDFEERHVRQGESVCAFGVYSSSRFALVPDEKWGRPTRLARGTAAALAITLRRRAVNYALGTIALGALAFLAAMFYLRS